MNLYSIQYDWLGVDGHMAHVEGADETDALVRYMKQVPASNPSRVGGSDFSRTRWSAKLCKSAVT